MPVAVKAKKSTPVKVGGPKSPAKAGGKKAAAKAAPVKGGGASNRLSDAEREEVRNMSKALFDLADENSSGTVQFFEFLALHHEFANHADEKQVPCDMNTMSDQDLEKQFRVHDKDHSMCLDLQEWQLYMEGILSVVGVRAFKQCGGQMLEDDATRREEIRSKYDLGFSSTFLEKCKSVHSLRGKMADDVLGLLERRANPNFTDCDSNFPLLFVAEKADMHTTMRLIEEGADVMKHSKTQECASFAAARVRNLDVLRLFLLPGCPVDDSREVQASLGHELVSGMSKFSGSEVRDLLQRKADINFRNDTGWTPLTAAVFWGNQEALETLLKAASLGHCRGKLLINLQNARGRSALHVAARKGRTEMIAPLLGGRGDPDLCDKDFWTPMHHASFNAADGALEDLIRGCGSLSFRGRLGFTPWMVSQLPSRAASLKQKSLELLQPPEDISFAKAVIPILNEKDLTPWQKLDGILGLKGVNQHPPALRMYEQFFNVGRGPSKVKLTKMWEGLAMDMVRRLKSGETEAPRGESHLSEIEAAERELEHANRLKLQRTFVKQWFDDTTGPILSADWEWDSRESYRESLEQVVVEEAEKFRGEFDRLYEELCADMPYGEQLSTKVPLEEVLKPEFLAQDAAHPILSWLDTLKLDEAVDALRSVGAAGMGKDDDTTLMAFMDLIGQRAEFETGALFWRNVYKLWLEAYAILCQKEFQRRIGDVCSAFMKEYEPRGLQAVQRAVSPKTFDRMAQREFDLGTPSGGCYEGRTVAAGLLDIVRASITVKTPCGVAVLVDEFFRACTLPKDKLQLVRIRNSFHRSAQPEYGYRSVVLTVLWDGGERVSACGRPDRGLRQQLVGEVQIVVESFLEVKKRIHPLVGFLDGTYDWNRRKHVKAQMAEDAAASDGEPEHHE